MRVGTVDILHEQSVVHARMTRVIQDIAERYRKCIGSKIKKEKNSSKIDPRNKDQSKMRNKLNYRSFRPHRTKMLVIFFPIFFLGPWAPT